MIVDIFLPVLLLGASFGSSAPTPRAAAQNKTIEWSQCAQNTSWPIQCGSLAVPLDYTNESFTQTLNLSLLKVDATKQPVQGSILFNPGGPGEGLLRFWGLSYGTVLGATVASMFPDRIDKILLDAVVNVQEWYSGVSIEGIVQADESVRQLTRECVAAPELCPLACKDKSADDVYSELVQLVNKAKFNPIVMGPNITTDIVEYGTLKEMIALASKYPSSLGPLMSEYVHAVLQRNLTAFRQFAAQGSESTPRLSPTTLTATQSTEYSVLKWLFEQMSSRA